MIEDCSVNIRELINLNNKSNNIKTINESNKIKYELDYLKYNINSIIKNKKKIKLTSEQKQFVNNVLPYFIIHNISKIKEVCFLYDIDIDNDILDSDYDEYYQ